VYSSILKATHFERGLHVMLIVSLMLHVGLLALVLGKPPDRSATIYFSPSYTVDLVSYAGSADHSDTAATGAPTGRAEPLWQGPAGLSSQIKDMEDRTHTLPKADPAPPVVRTPPGNADRAGTRTDQQASGRTASPEEIRFGRYYMAVFNKIQSAWILPHYHEHRNLLAIVEITIRSDGRIVNIQFEKRSGNAEFDRSVMRAVQKANPLPPLPPGIKEPLLTLGIRFQ
jgi:TonB family protein